MLQTYKDLKFWQTSRETSCLVFKFLKKLPNDRAIWIISDQILRSTFSVGANIAEGYVKYRGKEYQRFLTVALGSASETEYWFELLSDLYPDFKTEMQIIISKNHETIKMLSATIKTLKNKNVK